MFVTRNGIRVLLRNGSERNSESLLLFLFHGSEFCALFSSAEWFGTEIRELLLFLLHYTEFRETVWKKIPRVFCSAEFRRNKLIVPAILPSAEIFLSDIANPTCKLLSCITMKLSQVSVPAPLYIDRSFSKMNVIVLTNSYILIQLLGYLFCLKRIRLTEKEKFKNVSRQRHSYKE